MIKKLSLLALCAIFSMFFFVSCEDEEEDTVDTENSSTQSDNDTTDSNTTDPTNQDDPTNPTDDPTDDPTDNPTDDPTDDPTDNPTDNPTDDPTDNPTDPTTNPGEGGDNLNTGDTSGNQAQTGATGAACTRDEDCTGTYSGSYGGENYDMEAFCLTENDSYFPAPGGYCTFNCDMTDHAACDNVGGVYHGYNSWGDGYCFHKCTKPSDCRVGYRCSNKIHACLPDCATTGCTAGTCDETDKVCL